MSNLGNIPIRVEQTPTQEDFAVALSVLHEIHTLLERLLAEGEVGAIDLRAVPNLNPASLGLLERWLATGEVGAVVTSVGRTEVRETAYPGVWWQVYLNENGDIVTESIHVTEVPDILISQKDDVKRGLRKLGGALKQDFTDQAAQ